MAKLSKRMRAIAEKIDAEKAYGIDEAVTLLNELAGSKFKESFDIAVNLGVDPRKSDQVVRGATTLPHGTGKTGCQAGRQRSSWSSSHVPVLLWPSPSGARKTFIRSRHSTWRACGLNGASRRQ